MKKANLLAAALAFVSINALAQPELVDVVVTDKSGKTQLVSVERDNLSHFKNTKAQEGLLVETNPSLFIAPPKKDLAEETIDLFTMKSTSVGTGNDPDLDKQLYLHARTESNLTGSNVQSAWELGEQVKTPKIAILDNGFLQEGRFQDVVAKKSVSFLPAKYGQSGWDSSEEELACATGHGLGVAGLIGAKRGDNFGIAGIVDADLYLVQVLSCSQGSGTLYNSALAIRWAAGDTIEGFETLEEPVDIINMSFGAEVAYCPSYMQDAINYANSKGVLVVAGAGNDSQDVSQFTAANCQGVVRASSISPDTNDLSDFANYGDVTVVAQGDRVFSYGNTKTTDTDRVRWSGTSFSAPIVSGSLALAKAHAPTLTNSDLITIMNNTAIENTNSECLTKGCGNGLIDTYALVQKAKSIEEDGYGYISSVLGNKQACELKLYETATGVFSRLCASFNVNLNPITDMSKDGSIAKLYKTLKTGTQSELVLETEKTEFIVADLDLENYTYHYELCNGESCGDKYALTYKGNEPPASCKE